MQSSKNSNMIKYLGENKKSKDKRKKKSIRDHRKGYIDKRNFGESNDRD